MSIRLKKALTDQTYADNVHKLENLWQQRGIHGVPAFIFNQQFLISGAQQVKCYFRSNSGFYLTKLLEQGKHVLTQAELDLLEDFSSTG